MYTHNVSWFYIPAQSGSCYSSVSFSGTASASATKPVPKVTPKSQKNGMSRSHRVVKRCFTTIVPNQCSDGTKSPDLRGHLSESCEGCDIRQEMEKRLTDFHHEYNRAFNTWNLNMRQTWETRRRLEYEVMKLNRDNGDLRETVAHLTKENEEMVRRFTKMEDQLNTITRYYL